MTCIACMLQSNNSNGVIGFCELNAEYIDDPEHICAGFAKARLDIIRYAIWFEKTQLKYGQIRLNALIRYCHEEGIDVKEITENV